ncbi:hypothetical protein GCM10010517_34260 [Streptosporangium fragile]|uniref:Lipoprotein n=1 Tax=Streptosporangium fragile TaxID=46186 RepID=A0ABP6IDV3_9ACTN
MTVSLVSRLSPVLLTGLTTLALTACSGLQWQDINTATLSEDERTLTVELVLASPGDDDSQCERITDTEVSESPSQVIIGIQVGNSCPRPGKATLAVGYVRFVKLKLRQPLSGRTVLDNTRHRRVEINRSPGGS